MWLTTISLILLFTLLFPTQNYRSFKAKILFLYHGIVPCSWQTFHRCLWILVSRFCQRQCWGEIREVIVRSKSSVTLWYTIAHLKWQVWVLLKCHNVNDFVEVRFSTKQSQSFIIPSLNLYFSFYMSGTILNNKNIACIFLSLREEFTYAYIKYICVYMLMYLYVCNVYVFICTCVCMYMHA